MSQKKTVNMKVPTHMVDQVELYLQQLRIVSNRRNTRPKVFNEVKKVLGHRRKKLEWQFYLLFSDNTQQWVKDTDCNCELLIKKYLQDKNVNTAYLICRVSTKTQSESNVATSLDAQASELKTSIKNIKQIRRIRVYKISSSAYRNIPVTLRRIGEAALSGDIILVWRVDRLSRNIVKYLSWLEDLNDRNIMIYSQNENIYYRSSKLHFIQCIIDAQKEAVSLGERVKLSNKRKRERGDEAVGSLPFGKRYKRLVEGEKTVRKIVVSHPEEVAAIQRVKKFESKRKRCPHLYTYARIAEELNDSGLLKRGRVWTKDMVRRIIKN